ncbi:hypothetical protein [Exiguobacterium artemiae]|uniref:hypothetical protein n=1 Tax=Exiguobacterium artemiae TaxID=340145 RepID=UPI00047D9C60|nr:hypothetical protein [Exiguobacterium sibiricum]
MKERKRSDRYSSGLNGKGTLLAILIVISIGAVGSMANNDETDEVKEPKQEAKAEDKKESVDQGMSEKKIKTTVKVQSPSDVSNLNEIQQAVNTGEDDLRDAIDSTNQFVDDLVTKQEALRKSKNFAIQDFQKTITDDVVEKLDNQISLLNDAAQTAHSMATGVFLNNQKNISVEGTENLDFVKLEQLADNFNSMAFSLETYGMALSFESWEEASTYLPSRREESLLAIPLNEAILDAPSGDALEGTTDASEIMSEDDGELIAELLDGQFQLTTMLKEADEIYYQMSLEYPAEGDEMTTGDALSIMINGMSEKIISIQKSPTADGSIKYTANSLSATVIKMQSTVANLISSEKLFKSDEMSARQDGYYRGQEAIQKLTELNSSMDTAEFSRLDLSTPDIDGV